MSIARAEPTVEIVSLDSMQVYRGMDVGTAKPTVADRAAVPHHLIDVADPSEDWSVARTQQLAIDAVRSIERRDGRALLVGGTGLYVSAVVDGFEIPGEDHSVRQAIEKRISAPSGLAHAYAELERIDPDAAARIEPSNQRRIARALEVIEVTGRRFSSFGPGIRRSGSPALDVSMVGIWIDRTRLRERIEARVRSMMALGLLDEVEVLQNASLSRSAAQAIGYAEVLAYLKGEIDTVQEVAARVERRTVAFARRQRMWFRRDPRVTWFAGVAHAHPTAAAVHSFWAGSARKAAVR